MKKDSSIIIIFFITLTALVVSTCRKNEEPESVRQRETLTTRFNESISADSLASYVAWLQEFGTRFALAPNHRDVALSIRNKFKSFGYENSRLDSFMINRTYRGTLYQQWQYNVIASITGSDYPDSVSIMGAHYDNIIIEGDPFLTSPGAHDNASGTAAVLEVARVMKLNNYTPTGTIEFVAFGSEELGLYGSQAYAGNLSQSQQSVKFMLNNDMIGYQTSANQSSWTVNILDYGNSVDLRKKAEKMADKFTVLNYFNDNTYNRYSDSYSFFFRGYKAIFFYSGEEDPYYHTLEDTVDKLNFGYSREIAKICCAMLVYGN